MITEKLLKQYKEYSGDLDAWSRFNHVESYSDWHLIENLVQNLRLIKNNIARKELIAETKCLISENVESDKAIELLYSIASTPIV